MRTIDGDDYAHRIFAMISRHAPRLMRQGGGALRAEREHRPHASLAEINEIRRLHALGLQRRAIANKTGYSYNTIVRHVKS